VQKEQAFIWIKVYKVGADSGERLGKGERERRGER